MKENSIEENIEILENFINWLKTDFEYNSDDEIKVIEHILSDYKRVLKENERYKKSDYEAICLENNDLSETTDKIQSEYNDLLKENKELKVSNSINSRIIANMSTRHFQDREKIRNSIPAQKVKDKIENLNDESHAEELEDIMNRKNYTITELVQYVLQELLEGENK